MKAIDNFDRTLNVKFSTYAVPMILGEVRRYLRDNNSIRVSRSLRDTAYKAIYAKEQLTKSMNRTPTIEEISKKTEISRGRYYLCPGCDCHSDVPFRTSLSGRK